MIEEWKVLKEWNGVTNKNSTHCSGDRIYVSNTGKVKLNDIELTLDRGLYIDNGEIYIVGSTWPFGNMYRTIYQLFTGKLKKGYGWNIHHIDGNHYNNNLDNLLQVTAFEHGKIHAEHDDDWGDKRENEWVEYQQKRAKEVIDLTKKWYKDRVLDFLEKQKEQTKLKIDKRKQEQIDKQQKDIENKLASGDYYYNKVGALRPKHRCDKGRPHSKEWNQKIGKSVHASWKDGTLKIANKGKKRYFDSETNKFYFK